MTEETKGKVENAANIGGVLLSAAMVVLQVFSLFRGNPAPKA